jgi:hypothetical protein
MAHRTKEPTTRGRAILRELKRLGFRSINAYARKAGVHETTLRRWIYSDLRRIDRPTVERLTAAGIPESLLVP